jgi:hypothetical protein
VGRCKALDGYAKWFKEVALPGSKCSVLSHKASVQANLFPS